MAALNESHDPALRSWVESANEPGTDFPIQNLPFCVFRRRGHHRRSALLLRPRDGGLDERLSRAVAAGMRHHLQVADLHGVVGVHRTDRRPAQEGRTDDLVLVDRDHA